MTWYQAYDYCQSIGAELASLGSSEELARFIKLNNKRKWNRQFKNHNLSNSILPVDGNENLEYWTSANARGNEDGIFRWLDGRVLPQSQIKNPTHTDKRGCIKLSITNKSKDISFFIDHCYHSRTQFICERSSRTNCLSTLIPYCKKRKHCVNKICPPNPCIEI